MQKPIKSFASFLTSSARSLKPKRYSVPWANYGPISRCIAHLIPTTSPPIVILSLPRSGSSWVGYILSLAGNALYLREPLSRTYLENNPGHPVLEIRNFDPPSEYKKLSNRIFSGLPVFPPTIVKHPQRWSLKERSSKRILVKEVNPLAGPWLAQEYQAKVIYLIRHPAAVAKSFHELGWAEPKFNQDRFSKETLSSINTDKIQLSDFWQEMGAYQAVLHNLTMKGLDGQEHRVVRYEDLCTQPVHEFHTLYRYTNLDWNDEIREEIISHSRGRKEYPIGEYGVFRDSTEMIDKWRTSMSKEEIDSVQEGYFSQNPPFYVEGQW